MIELEDVKKDVSINNNRPIGFETHICAGHACIKEIPVIDEVLGSLTLSDIFGDFTRQRKFLPPMVLAKTKKKMFHFLGFFAVRAADFKSVENNFQVYMKESWTGTNFTPEFLLDYSCSKAKINDPFVIFQVDFKIKFDVAPKSITSYVWNQDPEGSRGTETTVQSSDHDD